MKKYIIIICCLVFSCTGTGHNRNRMRARAHDIDRNRINTVFTVDVCNLEKAYAGNTLLSDNTNPAKPRIIEVKMQGDIVWEYVVPEKTKKFTNPGFDTERLSNGNTLAVFPGYGILEIDRSGNTVWQHLDNKLSHDADRLPNGNTLYVFGANDTAADLHVKEVDSDGSLVWSWSAGQHFLAEYKDVSNQGWTHANSVSRLPNGNTLVSLRNFNILAEVDKTGNVVNVLGKGILHFPHDPEYQADGHILLANQAPRNSGIPHRALEFDPGTNKVIWQYEISDANLFPVRDADRLPNGNTLITGSTKIIEVTRDKEIVWQLSIKEPDFEKEHASSRGFYKAQRIW